MEATDQANAAADAWFGDAILRLREAAVAGDGHARAQVAILDQIEPQSLLTPPGKERIHEVARVYVCRGFAPAPICDWLIARSAPNLRPSTIHDARTGEFRVDPRRTATTAGIERDIFRAVMQERAARLTGVPISHHEPPNIISYEPGQLFDFHHDYINPAQPGAMPDLIAFGQRMLTIVTYLNEDFEGAATEFPRLGVSFRGAKGDAILFSNVLPDGAPDTTTLHAGLPPTAGRKWVLSQWIRNRPLPVARS